MTGIRRLYLTLTIVGAIVPYVLFGPLILEGAGIGVWLDQLLSDPAPRGLTGDITVAAITFLVWSWVEAKRRGMGRWWIYPVVMCTVGLSCSFPLFLYNREGVLERESGVAEPV